MFAAWALLGSGVPTARADPGTDDETALALGRKVLAVQQALTNPSGPNAMKAVTELGHDQRYYVMVRGWIAYQLAGDRSILEAGSAPARDAVTARINFIEKAIRAIDLEQRERNGGPGAALPSPA
jgi:hypothetical protein